MIHDLVLPQLAMGMSEGTVVEWSVPEGGHVERDATLMAIETEKVVVDLPAPRAGWVHQVARVGNKLPVETLIARIADTEAEYRGLVADANAVPASAASSAPAPTAAPTQAPLPAAASPVLAPPPATPAPTTALAAATTRLKASGLARKLAAERGIDLHQVPGSGPGGRIVRRDLYRSASTAGQPALPCAHASTTNGSGMRVRAQVPMTGMRRAIAERMVQAKTTAAHTYAFFELDLTKLETARDTMLAREKELGGRISMTALYAKALALACRHVPICNATIDDEQITVWENVNIGIAVALPGKTEYESGLLVPVVRDVQSKGLVQLSLEIKDLVARAPAA